MIYEHEEPWWHDINRGTPDSSAQLSGNPTNRDIYSAFNVQLRQQRRNAACILNGQPPRRYSQYKKIGCSVRLKI
jgi:hypothetical protein